MALIHRILVPTDFSDGAKRALEYGAELARAFSVPLLLTHVYAPPMIYTPETVVWVQLPSPSDLRADLESALGRVREQALALGVTRVDTEVVEGDPAREIVRLAGARDCDLVVMGTHGRGGVKHLLLGSVAEKVVRKAACPVLTVGPHTPPVAH